MGASVLFPVFLIHQVRACVTVGQTSCHYVGAPSYRLMAKGMPNIMVGSVHRFPKDDVLAWLEETEGGTLSG